MNDTRYPDNWFTIAREIKEACDWRCSECDTQCRRPGEFNLGWQYTLTVAHYDGEYEAPAVFVVALCIRCHFRHDVQHTWKARRRNLRVRRRMAGQLEIFTT